MSGYVLLSVLLFVLVMLVVVSFLLGNAQKQASQQEGAAAEIPVAEKYNLVTTQSFVYTAIVLTSAAMVVSI
jgi:hypothetical protein